MRASKNVRS